MSSRDELLKTFPEAIPVLDDGFIRIVDCMGDDSSVVQAARVSYGEGTKSVRDDRGLIRYLMRHHHTTPLESCIIKLHWRLPMDVARQAIRHRSASLVEEHHGMWDEPSLNEYSTRYSLAIDSAQKTDSGAWRLQSRDNKQGSSGFVEEWPEGYIGESVVAAREAWGNPDSMVSPGDYLSAQEGWIQKKCRSVYEERLAFGVAREQARKDLPLSTYTEMYWIQDLWNLLHFLRLRLHPHAQQEVRAYAEAISQIVKAWVPYVYEAFEDYMLEAATFSRMELRLLIALLRHEIDIHSLERHAKSLGMSNREIGELNTKLKDGVSLDDLPELGTKYDQ